MARRGIIGLNFFFDNQSNSGIVNYIYNIISALNTLPYSVKPKIVLFYSRNAPIEYLKEINYPFIRYKLFETFISNRYLRRLNDLQKKLTNRDAYLYIKYFSKIDCLYPYFEFMDHQFLEAPNKLHWLVDFNNRMFEDHYQDNGHYMTAYQHKITSVAGEKVILSSNTLRDELVKYYPDCKCDISILKFASSVPKVTYSDIEKVESQYNLQKTIYFMSPNQFWQHKNQEVVLEAIKKIKQNAPNLKFKILFTGSLVVTRGKGTYSEHLYSLINEFNINEYVELLGVLERRDQIALMKGARALIQPSLYEGWSTLVEEAKALNQYILLSDLPVHREQIAINVDFFHPENPDQLAGLISAQIIDPKNPVQLDYMQNIREFGETIKQTFLG